jgi:hypothetical protein
VFGGDGTPFCNRRTSVNSLTISEPKAPLEFNAKAIALPRLPGVALFSVRAAVCIVRLPDGGGAE